MVEEGKDLAFFARTLKHLFSTAIVWGVILLGVSGPDFLPVWQV